MRGGASLERENTVTNANGMSRRDLLTAAAGGLAVAGIAGIPVPVRKK